MAKETDQRDIAGKGLKHIQRLSGCIAGLTSEIMITCAHFPVKAAEICKIVDSVR